MACHDDWEDRDEDTQSLATVRFALHQHEPTDASPYYRHLPLADDAPRYRHPRLAIASEMLANGDDYDAVNEVWWAVDLALQVIADKRGWPYRQHRDTVPIVAHIAQHAGNSDIVVLFTCIRDLRRSWAEDTLPHHEIQPMLYDAYVLLQLLRDAHVNMPVDLPMPANPHYLMRVEIDERDLMGESNAEDEQEAAG